MSDDRIHRIENKIDKLDDHLGNIDKTLVAQHASLKEHIRRTELLENDVAPIKKHVNMVHGALKFIGLLAVLGGIIEGAVALLTFLKDLK